MKKKRLLSLLTSFFLVATLVGSSLMMSCAKLAPAPTLTPSPTPALVPTEDITPAPVPTENTTPTPKPAAEAPVSKSTTWATSLPIIDMHFHFEQGWDIDELVKLFDQKGVAVAANGAKISEQDWVAFTQSYPDRFLPFGGQEPFRRYNKNYGEGFWNAEASEVIDYLRLLETNLQSGRVKGIGELMVNKTRADLQYPADSPIMQRLWSLSVKYGVPLSVHMDKDPSKIAEMERLLASDRQGIWIWAHAGQAADIPMLRSLLQKHTNLYIELSTRLSIFSSLIPGPLAPPIDENGILKQSWKGLFQEFPDRFVIGTDLPKPSLGDYSQLIMIWRQILNQLPSDTAAKIAFQNAERLLKVSVPQ